MKKLFGFLLLLILAIGLGVALLPSFLSTDIVRARVAQQLSVWTGRDVRLAGPAALTVFPNISVDISDISIANGPGFGDEPMIAMDGLRARIMLWPLLSGDIRVERFELVRPRIDLVVNETGQANWDIGDDPDEASKNSDQTADGNVGVSSVKLGLLQIEDGVVRYRNLQTGQVQEISALNTNLNWPDPQSSLASSGSLVWNGEVIRFEASLDDPVSFFNSGTSEATLAIVASPARVTVAGLASLTIDFAINGSLNLEIPSLRGLARWLGTDISSGAGLGELTIQSNIMAGGHKISLSEARIMLDGNEAEGALALVSESERLYLQASLALTNLDLNPYLAVEPPSAAGAAPGAASGQASGQGWDDEPFGLGGLGVLDADIRLSAGNIDLGRYDIGAGAISIALKEARMVLEIAELNAYGGELNGNIVVNARGTRPSMTAKINGSEIAIGPLLDDIADNGRLTGTANLALDLASSGKSTKEIVANLSGTSQLQVIDGEIIGINITTALSGLQRGDISSLVVNNDGRSKFEFMEASFTIEQGIATNQDLATRGPAFSILGSGTINMPLETLDYSIRASLLDQTRPEEGLIGAPLFEIPLSVRGSWAAPRIRPDLVGALQNNERVKEVVRDVEDAIRQGDLDGAQDAVEEAIRGGGGDVRNLLDNLLNRDRTEPPAQN